MIRRLSTLPLIACALALGAAACGDADNGGGDAPNLSAIPTATLPAQLPEVRILGSSAIVPGAGATYTVKSGDTLLIIADFLGVTLEDLMAANPGVDSSALLPGQMLVVPEGVEAPPPAAQPSPTQPPAVVDDTPIPVPPPPSGLGQTYVVQSGDIPETIAAQFGITTEELLAANPGIDPRGLQIGQVLIIPVPVAPPTEAPVGAEPSP